MADIEQGLDGHGSITQPTETVIPISHLPYSLRQTGGHGRHHRAIAVGHELQYKHAPFDYLVIPCVTFGMVCPIQPIHQSAAIFQFLPFDIHRNDLLIERKQKKLILF